MSTHTCTHTNVHMNIHKAWLNPTPPPTPREKSFWLCCWCLTNTPKNYEISESRNKLESSGNLTFFLSWEKPQRVCRCSQISSRNAGFLSHVHTHGCSPVPGGRFCDVSCHWCRVKKAYNPFEEDDDENEVDHPSDM